MNKTTLIFFTFLFGISLQIQPCCPPGDDCYGYDYGSSSPRVDLLVSLINVTSLDMDLFLAIYDKDFALAEECLDKGANIYFTTRDGKTPLHLLMSIIDRIYKDDAALYYNCAQKLVKLGVDHKNYNRLLHMEDRYHETAYDYAVSNKAPQNIKELVKLKNK